MEKVNYIFIVGTEGSGQRYLKQIIKKANDVQYSQTHHVVSSENNKLREWLSKCYSSESVGNKRKKECYEKLERIVVSFPQPKIFIEDRSFPFSTYRDISQQWNIVEIFDMLKNNMNIKFIFISAEVV